MQRFYLNLLISRKMVNMLPSSILTERPVYSFEYFSFPNKIRETEIIMQTGGICLNLLNISCSIFQEWGIISGNSDTTFCCTHHR